MRHRFSAGTTLELNFTAPLPGVVALFGPSGSGKTTLVHCIAGLFRAERSVVQIGDVVLSNETTWLRPERRRIGLVFQQALLFPHLSVAANLRYGAQRGHRSRRRGAEAVGGDAPGFDELVALLGLERLLARRPRALSGGERQRVAIGRAILSQPLLLAMDEPLSGLDDERRAEILPYLGRLRRRLSLPILYVTHGLDEVIRLADTLVLLQAGRVVASGAAAQVLGDVAGPLAGRDDAACLLEGRIVSVEASSGLVQVAAGGFRLRVPSLGRPVGGTLRLKIPAHEVMLASVGALPTLSVQNVLAANVLALHPDASQGVVTVSLASAAGGEGILLCRITADSSRRLALAPGVAVLALVKSVSIVVMEPG